MIRLARRAEQQELEALQLRAALNNPGDRAALLAHPEAAELPMEHITNEHVFVVEDTGQIQGFATILPREDGNVELDGLFVEPEMWRRGYGKRLIAHCAQVARSRGAQAIHVIANPHAEDFYRACGFEKIGTTQTQFGPGWLMRKVL